MRSKSDKNTACPELAGRAVPGFVETGDDIPREMPLVSICKPPPAVLREMLYDLIRQFGTRNACSVLGFEWSSKQNPIGCNVTTDRISACTTPRAVWLTWSIFNCPSNLTPIFNMLSWGIHNPEYSGDIADGHRAVYQRKLSNVGQPKRTKVERRRDAFEKDAAVVRKHVAAELGKLSANDPRRDPRNPKRAEFIRDITVPVVETLKSQRNKERQERLTALSKFRKRGKQLKALASATKKTLPPVGPRTGPNKS
tara:strand:- start:245 stop:1006 length:762 start_codon:yes stop_codon:yes gene_type:complete